MKGVRFIPRKPFAAGVFSFAFARMRAGAVAVVVVIVVAGAIPGAPTVSTVETRSEATPAVPGDLDGRDGAADLTVRSAPDGAVVRAATIRVLATFDGHLYLAQTLETDTRGKAHLSKLPRGDVWVLVDAPGRARGSARLTVDAEVHSITIDLGVEHSLEVVVSDELGGPIEGAAIEVLAPDDALPVGGRTHAGGRARVGRLGAGPWRAIARMSGYEEAAGQSAEGAGPLPLVLHKLGAITARVLAEDGEPAIAAHVAVAGVTMWPARTAAVDAQGRVRVGGLVAGTYALRASQGDTVSAIEFDVAIGRGEEKAIDLKLVRGRFVPVRVTDGDAVDAAPIPAARVTLAESGLSPFPLEATTDSAGRARLGPIAAGGAALNVRADGFVRGGPLAVPDPPPVETRVALVRSGVLSGRVVDARGRPIDGATLEIVGTDFAAQPIYDDPRRSRFQTAHFDAMLAGPSPLLPAGELGVVAGPLPPIPFGPGIRLRGDSLSSPIAPPAPRGASDPWVTRADGTFRAAPASPGRVRVVVHHPQYVAAESEIVTLAPGGEATVDVVLHEGGMLEGRVVDAQSRPVAGARVVVFATRGSLERSTQTASDGSFAFAALPEEVIVTASVPDLDTPDARMTAAIPEGGRVELTIGLPEPRPALPVSVVDENGWPLAAAQVSASSLSPAAMLRTTTFTDAHGDAALRRARGLPLRVEVRAPSYAPRTLTADGSEDGLRIELVRGESAMGEVVAKDGREAIVGAQVTVYSDVGARRAQTDVRGTFALTDLSSGVARMRVRAPGYAPWSKPVTIPASSGRRRVALPRVELTREGIVEGEVVDARGDPIAGARVGNEDVPTWLVAGAKPDSVVTTDSKGRFAVHELPEGAITLEAYAPGVGRARTSPINVVAGRTTDRVRIAIAADDSPAAEPAEGGGIAVTLGETGVPPAVLVVSVVEQSEAERAGVMPGDVIFAIDGETIATIEQARAKLSGPLAEDVVVSLRRSDRSVIVRVPREVTHR